MPSDPKLKDTIRKAVEKDGFVVVGNLAEPSVARTLSVRELEEEESLRKFYIPKKVSGDKKNLLVVARPGASFAEVINWIQSNRES